LQDKQPSVFSDLKKKTEDYHNTLDALYTNRSFAPPTLEMNFTHSEKHINHSGSLRIGNQCLEKIPENSLSLDLSYCILITKIDPILKKCIYLESLKLEGLDELSSLETLPPLRYLIHLNLLKCPRLEEQKWGPWIASLPSLKELRLCCENWRDLSVFECSAPLSFIHLASGPLISEVSLSRMMRGHPYLGGLCLEDFPNASNHLLEALEGKPMRDIGLSSCPLLTDEGLAFLHSFSLQWLMLHDCPKITEKGLLPLKKEGLKITITECPNIDPEPLRKNGLELWCDREAIPTQNSG
jgi:hypothetical protein